MSDNVNRWYEEYMKKHIKVDSILSKPRAGWTTFRLGDSEYELSYLQDIPCLWLDAAIYGNRTGMPYVVLGDCEQGFMYCVVIGYNIHIFYEDRYQTSYIIDKDFAEIIMEDISRDLDAWAEWTCSCGRGREDDIPQIKKQLQSKMDTYRSISEERIRQYEEQIHHSNEISTKTEDDEEFIFEIDPEESF